MQWKTLGDFAENFQKWLELPDKTLPHLQKGLNTIALPATLSEATWEQLLLHLVPSWSENGTKLAGLKLPKKQVSRPADIKEVPSWSEKDTNLLTNKLWYLISILGLSTEPVRIAELLDWMDYKNRTRFRNNYVNLLKQRGLVTLTNVETPNDPDNKYVITEAGKAFLAGI